MKRDCIQTNIPQVDNNEAQCTEVTREDCVVSTKQRLTPVRINVGDGYGEILDKLLLKIRDMEERINTLEG